MSICTLATTIGKGLVAGVAGTAAMTLSSTLEARLRGREFSTAPAKAAQKLLGIKEFTTPAAEARFSNLVHWGYGTGWGVARAVLGRLLGPKAADAAHFGAVWGSALVMLPALDVAPPAWTWGAEEVAIDVFHHAVYVTTTGIAYDLLD
jgi:uncharacterized membrane protein YagU involved in acid resistance